LTSVTLSLTQPELPEPVFGAGRSPAKEALKRSDGQRGVGAIAAVRRASKEKKIFL